MNDVVVLLPGILGSALRRDGRDVWALSGGAIARTLGSVGSSIKDLALVDQSGDPDVAADGVTADRLLDDVHMIPGLWKIDGYTKVATTLKKSLDLREGQFFTFPYDWRRDNRVSAKQLAKKAKTWLTDWRTGSGNKDAKLILLGHSMGGLVSRYFLELLDGWRDTRMLITFGTPYRGSANALNTLANGLHVGWGPLGLDLTPFAQSLPSLHQLLPIYPCYDAGDGALQRCYEAPGIPNLNQAKAKAANDFHREIEQAVTKHLQDNAYMQARYAIHPIVGRKQRTLQSGRLKEGAVEMLAKYEGKDLEGDGTVPRVSATPIELSDRGQEIFAAELHGSLQNADDVLVNVEGILTGLSLNADKFKAAGGKGSEVRLTVADAHPAGKPVAFEVAPEDEWADLNATVVDVDSKAEVANVPAGDAGSKERTVTLGSLPVGCYRITVQGGGARPVTDVFAVM
jgi:pimeloyl-ACP methyl ester carboxylesterase